jgi:hypothetical protein
LNNLKSSLSRNEATSWYGRFSGGAWGDIVGDK